MGLFSKYSNLYFTVARKISEAVNEDRVISRLDLSEIVNKYGVDDSVSDDNCDFINALTCRSDKDNKFDGICILEPVDEKNYRSIIKNIPRLLSEAERLALIDSLHSDISAAFIPKNIFAKLGITPKSTKHTETLGMIVSAIKTDKWIRFDNNAADGKIYDCQHLKPQKIEYSLSSGDYFVSGYCKEAARLIKCNIKRIIIHNIEEGEEVDVNSALIQKRCCQPICLCIENQRNVIDRAFNMFSGYERDGFYDKENDRYMLNIHYYEFQERLLLGNILSLGPMMVVVSPSWIRDKISDRIRQQLCKLT